MRLNRMEWNRIRSTLQSGWKWGQKHHSPALLSAFSMSTLSWSSDLRLIIKSLGHDVKWIGPLSALVCLQHLVSAYYACGHGLPLMSKGVYQARNENWGTKSRTSARISRTICSALLRPHSSFSSLKAFETSTKGHHMMGRAGCSLEEPPSNFL